MVALRYPLEHEDTESNCLLPRVVNKGTVSRITKGDTMDVIEYTAKLKDVNSGAFGCQ